MPCLFTTLGLRGKWRTGWTRQKKAVLEQKNGNGLCQSPLLFSDCAKAIYIYNPIHEFVG